MTLFFVTGNKKKVAEVKAMGLDVEQLGIELPEIQELDAHKIIAGKLHEARTHHQGAFIVEDTSLYIDALQGLPGPFIKWFLQTVGDAGLYKMTEAFGSFSATAKTIIGYSDEQGNIAFFEGEIQGQIIAPRGISRFGWDAIFVPDGHEKTFAEMTDEEKNTMSMRRLAVDKLTTYLGA
jgi:inosine triphosphate pyrophosphatase